MKKASLLILTFLILFSFQSCNNEEGVSSSKKSKVTFSLNTADDAKGRKESSELAGTSIVLSIETTAGVPVLSYYYIQLLAFGDDYVSQQIELEAGNYVITQFYVVDNNTSTVLYATPNQGSALSNLVRHPLPFSFNVSANNLSSIEMDVVPVNDHEPQDFGYAAFKVKVVRPGQDSLNLIRGGTMGSLDEAYWTKISVAGSSDVVPLTYQFGATGGPTSGDGAGFKVYDAYPGEQNPYTSSIFYQALNLTAGNYKFSADLKFDGQTNGDFSSAYNFWFEFLLDPNKPVEYDGFDKQTVLAGLNGWVNGDKAPIDGPFPFGLDQFEYQYPGIDTNTGIFTVDSNGVYYFVIKAGLYYGSFGPNGLIVDNVSLTKVD